MPKRRRRSKAGSNHVDSSTPDGPPVLDVTPLPAGDFSTWMEQIDLTLQGKQGSDVPCGDCNACCRSGYFIHVSTEDHAARAVIPRELLFAAPGLGEGEMLMGFDENGQCPMLVEDQCTIYHERPQTCRNFDCRVFAAAGMGADDRPLVDARSSRWEFEFADDNARELRAAISGTAQFLKEQAARFPQGTVPLNQTQLAALAVRAAPAFLAAGGLLPAAKSNQQAIDALHKAMRRALEALATDAPTSS